MTERKPSISDERPLISDERLLDNLVMAQAHVAELACTRDRLQRENDKLRDENWTLRLVLKNVWAENRPVEEAVSRCGLNPATILPLLRVPEPATR